MTKLQRELNIKFEIGKLSFRNEILDTVIKYETAQVGQVEVEQNIQNVEEQNVKEEQNVEEQNVEEQNSLNHFICMHFLVLYGLFWMIRAATQRMQLINEVDITYGRRVDILVATDLDTDIDDVCCEMKRE
ncbi:uncharacterized protein B0P05DRAFT_546144 [Gilbertella persicaria]|uniref:uncharacterized protein n=1 Tax=Gilbertella persicaria TaxID=101096 RepID=UPI00221F0DB1|nr:uncharacterized protein B0P05DRAFT_546144 [Gilbertella persicaria]KAI8076510.1 hypothetical protein B0P05DRAFT_546144 [Gilbertella persicaria]